MISSRSLAMLLARSMNESVVGPVLLVAAVAAVFQRVAHADDSEG